MKPRLLDLLACPMCGGDLRWADGMAVRAADEVIEGDLECQTCARRYPIRRGIPRMLPDHLSDNTRHTARAFGWQWRHFVEMHDQYETQFLDWVHPLDAAFFRDKVVLDAGCGIGRHACFAAAYGARDVVAMDLSDAVETARDVLAPHDNAHVVQGDVLNPPFPRADRVPFDLAYSIGVLHHLPDPEAGFASLAGVVQEGGTVFAWVYGYENNGVVRHVVDPLRRHLTSRLPPSLMRAIALPLAIVFHAVVKGIYGPLRRTAALRLLPLGDYLASVSSFTFRQNYNIVFDQLVAPTAHYLRGQEFEAWFQRAGLEHVELSWRNRNSWRGRGQRPS
jgi:uncharacterized protein YbaR (Trm112 family)/ubiquinone/menaquinone biosynthesis C-methylase UbiE